MIAIEEKEKMVKGLVMVHDTLLKGSFPGALSYQCGNAIQFIQSWHAASLKDLEADPAYQEKKGKEGSNGQESTN